MTNTKRFVKEPERSPLQTRASTLLASVFQQGLTRGGIRRGISARPKHSLSSPSAKSAAENQSQSQPLTGSPDASTAVRCSSPTLEGSTAQPSRSASQQLLPGSLLHLDSGDVDLDLLDLSFDEDDGELAGMAGPASVGHRAAAHTAPGAQRQSDPAIPTGAYLCQQLSQQLSGQQDSVLTTQQQQQQQQQQQHHQQVDIEPDSQLQADALGHAAAGCHNPTSSPTFDGTAYIVETATSLPGQLTAGPAAVPAAGAAAADAALDKADHGERLTAVEEWLEGLSVESMLDQQYKLELQQQGQQQGQEFMPTAATEDFHLGPPFSSLATPTSHTSIILEPPTASSGAAATATSEGSTQPNLLQQHQQYENQYQQRYDQYVQQYMPTGLAASLSIDGYTNGPADFMSNPPAVPEAWQHQSLEFAPSASLPMTLEGTFSSSVQTTAPSQLQPVADGATMAQQQTHLHQGTHNAQHGEFTALLFDEPLSALAAGAHNSNLQPQQCQMHHQSVLYQPAQQQPEPPQRLEDLAGTPAGNYLLLQQKQQQRRQQQLQFSQLQTAYSAPAHLAGTAAPGGPALAHSLPHSLQASGRAPAPASAGLLQPEYSQPVRTVALDNAQHITHPRFNSGYKNSSNVSGFTGPSVSHPHHTVTTTTAGIQYSLAPGTSTTHVTSAAHPMQMHVQQHQPPQQQLSASQQELLALKQQLAEEKRRRKEKKKLRKMQKLLLEHQQQQQQGQLQHQHSGLSQQVLLAAGGQQRPSPCSVGNIQGPEHTSGNPNGPQGGPQAWRAAGRQQGGLAQQHSWPQNPTAASNSSGSSVIRYSQAPASAQAQDSRDVPAGSPHAWQFRSGSSSSPHAVIAGYPVDSASAARQHAVAQSLRQLANKSNQPNRPAQGTSCPSIATSAAAAAGVGGPVRRSPSPPSHGGSSSIRYSPYGHVTFTRPPHHHLLVAPGPTQTGTPSHPAVPAPHLEETKRETAPEASSSGNQALNRPPQFKPVGDTGFSHGAARGVLPGVPVVLDLGDKEPDSQAGPHSSRAAPEGLVNQFSKTEQVKSQVQQHSSQARDGGNTAAANASAGAAAVDSANMHTTQHQQQQAVGHSTLVAGDKMPPGSCTTAAATMHAGMTMGLHSSGTSGGTSPMSTTSSGRKRSFDQTASAATNIMLPESSHSLQQQQQVSSYGASPTSPAVELQVLTYGATAYTHASSHQEQQQQQQNTGNSSQRQTRLLQLPFNGPDLAERRERERTPINALDGPAVVQHQQAPTTRAEARGAGPPQTGTQAAAPSQHKRPVHIEKQSEQFDIPLHGSSRTSAGMGSTAVSAYIMPSDKHVQSSRRSLSYTGDVGGPAPGGQSDAYPDIRPRSVTFDGSCMAPRTAVDHSMPPPPPHTTAAAAGLGSPVSRSASAVAAGGCMSPGNGAGCLGGAGGGFSAVLGGGNIYRTSSGKVLRMLTHPVTGKPLLLGPAVDAKSSRLGNTSLGAPAPQLFGLELQTANNNGGSALGGSAGSMSGVSGCGSLGSPGTSSSMRGDGSSSRSRRQSNSGNRTRRRTSTAANAAVGNAAAVTLSANNPGALAALMPQIPGFEVGPPMANQGLALTAAEEGSVLATIPQGFELTGCGFSPRLNQGLGHMSLNPSAYAPTDYMQHAPTRGYTTLHGDMQGVAVAGGQGVGAASNLASGDVDGWGVCSYSQPLSGFENDGLLDLHLLEEQS